MEVSKKTKEKVLKELRLAGMNEDDFGSEDNLWGHRFWIDYIAEYRETGRCGSVNSSSVDFIPIMSKMLDAIRRLSKSRGKT